MTKVTTDVGVDPAKRFDEMLPHLADRVLRHHAAALAALAGLG
jgi:hypothetical protein